MTTKRSSPKNTPATSADARSLAAHAEAAHAAKLKRLAAEGRAAIRTVRARSVQNSANYYDIGDALRSLARPGVAEAIGRADFAEVCAKDLDLSVVHARRLMDVTARLRREVGETMSIRRAGAIVALVDATPADDTPDDVLAARLTLPDGEVLDVASASTAALVAAATAFRAAGSAPARGLTKSPAEKRAYKRVEAFVNDNPDLGIERTALKARHDGAVITLQMPIAQLHAFARRYARVKAP